MDRLPKERREELLTTADRIDRHGGDSVSVSPDELRALLADSEALDEARERVPHDIGFLRFEQNEDGTYVHDLNTLIVAIREARKYLGQREDG